MSDCAGFSGESTAEAAARSPRVLTIPKTEGERIIAPTLRPDGTLRKPIRIRPGYTPQDEVAIYQPKGALMRKSGPDLPPGYAPPLEEVSKPKTKSAKRNERRKEKRQQAALASSSDKGKNLEQDEDGSVDLAVSSERSETIDTLADKINYIAVSESISATDASMDSIDNHQPESSTAPDIDKKIRALKKKIRLAEAQLQGDIGKMKPEQLEKMKKMQGWREELELLEAKRAIDVS